MFINIFILIYIQKKLNKLYFSFRIIYILEVDEIISYCTLYFVVLKKKPMPLNKINVLIQ